MEKIVTCNGALYSMSQENFEQMLADYMRGENIHLPDYGWRIHPFNFSNISRTAAGEYLNGDKLRKTS